MMADIEQFWQGRRVTVTGGAGFLGSHLVPLLEEQGARVHVPRRADWDLTSLEAGLGMLEEHPADVVIHAAAYYGGLGINQVHPGRIYWVNMVMGANLMEASRRAGVAKFVTVGTACAYPGYLQGRLEEKDLWAGPLHESVEHYGLSKKALHIQGRAYRKEWGFPSIHLILTNLYGPGDCYHPDRSHVVAALIRKFVEARLEGRELVEVWGSGRPVREFLYAGDAAEGIARAAALYDDTSTALNIGTGVGTSIRELVEAIHEITGYEGRIEWDASMPDGAAEKVLDIARMQEHLDWRPRHDLREGLAKTIEWYRENKDRADAKD